MAYDTATTLAHLQPPVFRHEGREWVGRHLSILEWMAQVTRIERLQRNELSIFQVRVLYRDLCNLLFPPPPRRLVVRLGLAAPRPAEESVADVLLRLPLKVQNEAMQDFFSSQARALGLSELPRLREATAPTTGASRSSPTPSPIPTTGLAS